MISVQFSFSQHNDRYCLFLYTGDKIHQLLVCHKEKNKRKKIYQQQLMPAKEQIPWKKQK